MRERILRYQLLGSSVPISSGARNSPDMSLGSSVSRSSARVSDSIIILRFRLAHNGVLITSKMPITGNELPVVLQNCVAIAGW